MSWGAVVGAGVGLVSGYLGNKSQSDAAKDAAGAQGDANRLAIEEQRRQFDAVQKLLAPYVSAGTGALGGQQALIGLSGADAQRQAIAALEGSPEFAAITQQGENAILSNASATGGLRGGNVQAALAQFRPRVLSALINQQYGRLGGLSSLGQNAAAGVGNAGLATGNNIAGILQGTGAANAGAALIGGAGAANNWANFGRAVGQIGARWDDWRASDQGYGSGGYVGGGGDW